MKTRTYAIPSLIINVLYLFGSVYAYYLINQMLENSTGTIEPAGGMEIGIAAILGMAIVVLLLLNLVWFAYSAFGALMKLLQVTTGKWGFAVPTLLSELLALPAVLVMSASFLIENEIGTGLIFAGLFVIPVLASLILDFITISKREA